MIKVIDNWEIDSDGYQYILQENTGKVSTAKDGKTSLVYKNTSYHTTIEKALQALMTRYQRNTVAEESMTLGEALQSFTRLKNEFEQLLEKVKKEEKL